MGTYERYGIGPGSGRVVLLDSFDIGLVLLPRENPEVNASRVCDRGINRSVIGPIRRLALPWLEVGPPSSFIETWPEVWLRLSGLGSSSSMSCTVPPETGKY